MTATKPVYKVAEEVFREHGGLLKSAQAKRLGVDPKTLSGMVDSQILVKETRGVYRLANLPPLEHPDLVHTSLRVPQAVICLLSALAYHNLTTQIPHRVYIALPRGAKAPSLEHPPLDISWYGGAAYRAGVGEHRLDGVVVRIYNHEKTVADCFKFRNKIGLDVALEALKDYLALPDRSIDKLLGYARIDRVANVMRPYLEASV